MIDNLLAGMIFNVYQLITVSRSVFCADFKKHTHFAQSDQVNEIWD